jgi:hypothetical protein
LGVVTPAVDGPGGGSHAASAVSRTRESGEEHGRAHSNRRSTKSQRAVAELTRVVVAPAVRGAVGRGDAAGVVMTAHERCESQRRAHSSRQKVVGTRSVAQLPSAVASPTVRDAADGQAAGVVGTGNERGEQHRRADGYWRVTTDHCAVAELPVLIVAPAVGRAGGHSHAADVATPVGEGGELDGRVDSGGDVLVLVRGAVAELAVPVVAPAVRGTVGRSQGAREVLAYYDGREGDGGVDSDRR